MGTRAFIEFPTYEVEYVGDYEYRWGKETGKLYLYTQYDGDLLPIDLKETLLRLTRPMPHEVPVTREQKLRMLLPEKVITQVICTMHDDYRAGSTYIETREPTEGYHLICDFSLQVVNYVGQTNRDESLATWIQREEGLIFNYIPGELEDYRDER